MASALSRLHPCGRGYRFKLSARLAASQARPWFTTRSPARSDPLGSSWRGRHHYRRLRSHPVWQTLRGFPASPSSGLTPDFQLVRDSGAFAPQARFVFAPVTPGWSPDWTWDKTEGLRQLSLGLIPRLPLAPSELDYEYWAPQNYPLARVGARLQSRWGALARLSPHA